MTTKVPQHETKTKHLQIENCVWVIEFNSEDTLSTCLQVVATLLFVAHCFVCIISTRNFTLFAKRFLRNLWDFSPLYGFSFLPQARFLGPIDKQEMCLVIIPKTGMGSIITQLQYVLCFANPIQLTDYV